MIASGADFPRDRIHEVFAAGKRIRVRSRQALTSAPPAHCKLRHQAAQGPCAVHLQPLGDAAPGSAVSTGCTQALSCAGGSPYPDRAGACTCR